MNIFTKARKYFLSDEIHASLSERKRLILTFYLALICIIVAFVYAALDLSNNVFYGLPSYVVLLSMSITSLFLIRRKRAKKAKVILMISANMVVFWTALIDPFETGVYLFFIPTGIGSFAMLGFSENRTGILLSVLTATLFLVAYLSDIKPIDIPRPSDLYITISFIFNYFISLIISILIVYFQMNLNRLSEDELIQKEIFANQKNSELQKVNEELDRFVYSVSHDLRSPLSSILGLINIARLTRDEEELNEILSMIEGRVHSQDHFIREIIDYSRNARTDLIEEPVRLRALVDDVILSLKYNKNADLIIFRNLIPESFILNSDRIRLTVIISNLIGNSIKYHNFNKAEPFVEIGLDGQSETIYVQDNGSGMKTEHLDKIFNMFYRGSDRSTGSGLGLFITREAVTRLGGAIQVRSVHGEGSMFLVQIPFR